MIAKLLILLFLQIPSMKPGHVGPAGIYPDSFRTPGAINTGITQQNIGENICKKGWSTKSIRPPSSYTTTLKLKQMKELGFKGKPGDYEEDHFISLELGGNPTDAHNLWPQAYEPRPGSHEKDAVEDWLHAQVCKGTMTLMQAQTAIVTDWYAVYTKMEAAKTKKK